jgi:hypothetical protein
MNNAILDFDNRGIATGNTPEDLRHIIIPLWRIVGQSEF